MIGYCTPLSKPPMALLCQELHNHPLQTSGYCCLPACSPSSCTMYSSGPGLAAPRHLSHAMTAVNHLFTFRGTGSLFFSVRPGLQIFEGPNTKKEGCEQEHGMERSKNFKLGLERKKHDSKAPSSC